MPKQYRRVVSDSQMRKQMKGYGETADREPGQLPCMLFEWELSFNGCSMTKCLNIDRCSVFKGKSVIERFVANLEYRRDRKQLELSNG